MDKHQCFSLLKKREKKHFRFFTRDRESIVIFFCYNVISIIKSGIKNGTEVTLNHSSNVISNSNDETNFLNELLLTDTSVSRLFKAFANGSSFNIKFTETQLSRIVQLWDLLLPILDPTLKTTFKGGLEVVKHGASILAKNATKYFVNKGINALNKKNKTTEGLGITLTSN